MICCTLESKLTLGWCSPCGGGDAVHSQQHLAGRLEVVCQTAKTVSPQFKGSELAPETP